MYDAAGKLITGGRGAGTADKRYYGKVDDHEWDVTKLLKTANKTTQMFKHWQHDVVPFWAAWLLDRKTWGPNVAKYLKVRPPVIDKKCPTNVVPPAK